MRGLKFHNYLVDRACQKLSALGYQTRKEHPLQLPDGRINFADIYAERDGAGLIIEVETSLRNVVSNVQKAALSGLPIWVIVPTRQLRGAIKGKLIRHRIPNADFPRICLLSALEGQKQIVFPKII